MIITKNIKLYPVGDGDEANRVYKYLRDGMYAQNIAMNQYMSALYITQTNDTTKEDRKELKNLFSRISSSKKGSAYSKSVEFAKGLPIGYFRMAVESDFKDALKAGLMYGKQSLPTYTKTNPLLVHVDYVRLRSKSRCDNGIYHNYESHTEFLEHLYKNDLEVFLKFANGITFKFVFGSPYKSHELRTVFKNIFEEVYDVRGSSIGFDKSGKYIILHLCMDVPVDKSVYLDEFIVVGVDLGMAIPAVCALNNDKYERLFLGSIDDFLRVRTQYQEQKRRLYKSLKMTNGGHGRKKKLQALERLSEKERNFVQTYNHQISKQIVDFALKHHAKYINLEDLSGFGKDKNGNVDEKKKKVLRNWSYYELQQYITYKAQLHGIEVRKVNPAYTSQTCSICGSKLEGQRKSQSKFVCGNPECKSHEIYSHDGVLKFNADFNAARNIAMSTDFVKDKKNKDEDD